MAPVYTFYMFGGGYDDSMDRIKMGVYDESIKANLLLRNGLSRTAKYEIHVFAVRNFYE